MGNLHKVNNSAYPFLITILILGFSLRMDVFQAKLHDFNIIGDAKNYLIMSRQIVDHGVYGYALGQRSIQPNAYVTPGYPLLLAAAYFLFHNPYLQVTAVRFLQVIIGGILSPLLAFLFVHRLSKRNGMALFAAFFTAIYPSYVIASGYILTEVCSLAAMLLYFYLQTVSLQEKKTGLSVLAGMAFAINILIRPTMFPLFILPFVFSFIAGKKADWPALVKLFIYAAFGGIILMVPWWVRNTVVMHRFILMSTGSGDPLLAGTYPYMKDMFQDYLSEPVRVSEAAYARKRIINGFLNEPLLYLKWYTVGKLGYLFDRPWIYWQASSTAIGLYMYRSHVFLHYLFIRLGIIGAAIGILRKTTLLFTSIYALSFLALLLIFIPERRYAYHIMFFLMLYSSYAVCYAAALLKMLWDKWLFRFKHLKPV